MSLFGSFFNSGNFNSGRNALGAGNPNQSQPGGGLANYAAANIQNRLGGQPDRQAMLAAAANGWGAARQQQQPQQQSSGFFGRIMPSWGAAPQQQPSAPTYSAPQPQQAPAPQAPSPQSYYGAPPGWAQQTPASQSQSYYGVPPGWVVPPH